MKFRNTLLVKYFGIIVLYTILGPILLGLLFWSYTQFFDLDGTVDMTKPNYTTIAIKQMWDQVADQLNERSDDEIAAKLFEIKEQYPEATIFWVDGEGRTRLKIPESAWIPDQWNAQMTIAFMKRSYGGNPYTVVSLLGYDHSEGFITIQISRSLLNTELTSGTYNALFIVTLALELALFILLSWFFFNRIRRRLKRLQASMKEIQNTGIPTQIEVHQNDEISDLERSFNHMVQQLKESRDHEEKEEQLRRQLIANLSHDLRTPLTTIQGHAYKLEQENLSTQGKEAIGVIHEKIGYLDQLIDNLLAFTLLSAGKYPYRPQRLNIIRQLRAVIAGWYPVLENEGFEIEINLPEEVIYWEVDPEWFQRIMDNLLQNILRYTKSGGYIGVSFLIRENTSCIAIEDRGPGMEANTQSVGAGIGLSIISLMTQEMGINWKVESNKEGTRSLLCKPPTQ